MAYNHTGHPEVYQYGDPVGQTYHYMSDGSPLTGEESNFWSNSPRSESPTPDSTMQNVLVQPYHYFNPTARSDNDNRLTSTQFRNGFQPNPSMSINDGQVAPHPHVPFVRIIKRRTTANKKERRRTQSINNAYDDLRALVNVPPDTKLSKIKTLRLATSYINYLVKALESNDPAGGFNADLGTSNRKSSNHPVQVNDCTTGQMSPKTDDNHPEETSSKTSKKSKRRTGWPQHVWALELEHHQAL